MPAIDTHPSAERLRAFGLGESDDAHVEAHVASCPDCQAKAAAVPDDRLVGLLRTAHAAESQFGDTMRDAATLPPSPSPAEPAVDAPDALSRHERYRLVRLLGQGGMGAVYEAEHRAMSRPVALKVINRAYTHSPAAVDRFRREVRAAARLSHPNIVTAFDAETAGETHFLVMEYVAGTPLSRVVAERGPLPAAEACDHVRQAALGLQHAHERGMVHRDVKPDNLILTHDGRVKVLDFGLAALSADAGEGLTEANVVMGTPDYLAPEQAEDARGADHRADVYGLGCTLFFLLTGKVPYPGGTALQKIMAHRERPVPAMPGVPADVAALVAKMMAKRPEGRFRSADDVAKALLPFTRTQPPKPRRRTGWLVAAGLLLCALATAGVVVHRIQTDAGTLEITTESDDVEVIVKQGGKVVRIIDTKTDKSVTLNSGVYELEAKGGEGLKIDLDKVTLKRGEKVLARVERLPKGAATARKGPADLELVRRISVTASRDLLFSHAVSKGGKYAWRPRRTTPIGDGCTRCIAPCCAPGWRGPAWARMIRDQIGRKWLPPGTRGGVQTNSRTDSYALSRLNFRAESSELFVFRGGS